MSKVKIEGNASGSGTLTISAPNTNTDRSLTLPDSAGEIFVGDITSADLPTGSVLQVVSTTKTDTFSTSTNDAYVDITGLSASITPTSTSSKIYVSFAITYGVSSASIVMCKLLRGSTGISIGDASGNRTQATVGNYPGVGNTGLIQTMANNYLDSPSTTSATTYKLQILTENGTVLVNRNNRDDNLARDGRYTSTITLMEIAG